MFDFVKRRNGLLVDPFCIFPTHAKWSICINVVLLEEVLCSSVIPRNKITAPISPSAEVFSHARELLPISQIENTAAFASNWYYSELSSGFQKGVKVALEGVSTSENRLSDSLCAKRRRASDLGFPPREDTFWHFSPEDWVGAEVVCAITWWCKSVTERVKQCTSKTVSFPNVTLMER